MAEKPERLWVEVGVAAVILIFGFIMGTIFAVERDHDQLASLRLQNEGLTREFEFERSARRMFADSFTTCLTSKPATCTERTDHVEKGPK